MISDHGYSQSFHQSSIIDIIDDKESLSQLIPIMKHLAYNINLNNLKHILKDAVLQSTPSNLKRTYHSISNIENTIPLDVLQHIESFNHAPYMRSVSKRFKRCFDLNENMQLRQRELSIKTELGINLIENKNKTWKVSDGSIETLNNAISKSKPGDTILIDNGEYILEDDNMFKNKMLQIIGIGNNVKIELPDYEDYVHIENSKLYFKNVRLCTMSMDDDGMSLGLGLFSNSSLWIENCEINFEFYGITVIENGNLCITNSIFSGRTDYQSVAIKKRENYTQKRKISILNCVFYDKSSRREEPIITVPNYGCFDTLKIIGNCFKNVEGLPIGQTLNDIQETEYIYDIRPSQTRNRIIKSNYVYFREDGLLRYFK